MILSDRRLQRELDEGGITVRPLGQKAIQPASIDLRLGNKFRVFRNTSVPFIDVRQHYPDLTELIEIGEEPFVLHPGEFVLGVTLEHVAISRNFAARVEGKSSLGRLGLMVHSTAGYVDPGFSGAITLELSNVATLPIALYAAIPIAQLSVMRLTEAAGNPYGASAVGSKYQGQDGPTESRYYLNFTEGE